MEVFHREGKKIEQSEIHDMLKAADVGSKGKISFDDFAKIMQETIAKKAHI